MKRWWTTNEKATAVWLYTHGWSMLKIGRLLDRNYSSVHYVIMQSGVPLRPAVRDDALNDLANHVGAMIDQLCPDCLARVGGTVVKASFKASNGQSQPRSPHPHPFMPGKR